MSIDPSNLPIIPSNSSIDLYSESAPKTPEINENLEHDFIQPGSLNSLSNRKIDPLPSSVVPPLSIFIPPPEGSIEFCDESPEVSFIIITPIVDDFFTTSTSKSPFVGAYGHVVIAGYDPTNKSAFAMSFSTQEKVDKCIKEIFLQLSKLAEEGFKDPVQIHLSEDNSESSKKITEIVITYFTSQKEVPIKIASKNSSDKFPSLLISSLDGSISTYGPT